MLVFPQKLKGQRIPEDNLATKKDKCVPNLHPMSVCMEHEHEDLSECR